MKRYLDQFNFDLMGLKKHSISERLSLFIAALLLSTIGLSVNASLVRPGERTIAATLVTPTPVEIAAVPPLLPTSFTPTLIVSITPTPTPTVLPLTPTPSQRLTPTPTPTCLGDRCLTPTITKIPTSTPTPSQRLTPTPKVTKIPTPTPSPRVLIATSSQRLTPTPTVTKTSTLSPTQTQNGLNGQYFNSINLSGSPILTRTDSNINFDWGTGSSGALVNSDIFSVRWTGYIKTLYSENYTFCVASDDGSRLWVKNKQIINFWKDQSYTEHCANIRLKVNTKYAIKLEFYDRYQEAAVKLFWKSSSQAKQIIPLSQLFIQ